AWPITGAGGHEPMNAAIEIIPVKALFTEALRESFDDLDIADKGATGYLADLLARFAATTEMLPEGVTGERLQSIAERMAEIQRSWSIDAEQFDPARELQIRRALADYTLFMSGFFWEAVKERSEEHTSELQSRFDLVCRLLLEKKKKYNIHI